MKGEHFCINCGAKLSYIRGEIWNCDFCGESFILNNLRREQEHNVVDYISSVNKAINLFEKGKETNACELLQELTDTFYDKQEVWLYLGQIYLLFNRSDLAMDAFNEVLKLNDYSKEIYFHIALVYEYNEQYDKAIEAIEKGLSCFEEPIDNKLYYDNDNTICYTYFSSKSYFYKFYGWYIERTEYGKKYLQFSPDFNGTYQELYIHCILLAIKNNNLKSASKYIKYALKNGWLHKYHVKQLCKAKKIHFNRFLGLY